MVKHQITQADIELVLAAAKQAGLTHYRVLIDFDAGLVTLMSPEGESGAVH